MLEVLHLKNVVLVKDMVIDFKSGFNVITGETGAGKSLIIKSLEVLSGTIASESLIHPDEDMAFIEATFFVSDSTRIDASYLDQGRLTVSRRFYRNRPTVNKVNFESVSLKTLKSMMRQVMFLTAQHQVMDLMNASNHLAMFDQFIGADIRVLFAEYQLEYKAYDALKKESVEVFDRMDRIANDKKELFELVDDIDQQQFSEEEEETLTLQQKKCEALNDRQVMVSKLLSLSNDVIDQMNAVDAMVSQVNESSVQPLSFDSLTILDQLKHLNQAMASEKMELEYLESVDLDDIQSRLHDIFQYKVKYRVNSVSELLELRDRAKESLMAIDGYQSEKDELAKKLATQRKKVVRLAIQLTEIREKHQASFEYIVLNQIKQLGMIDAKFSLSFSTVDDITPHGQDAVLFMFSANPNMPIQPLSKVASGGELSRIMLALLVSSNGVLSQPLVVFDEIDVGVGGMTANYIGTTLQKMSKSVQLIVVTHLPQIARCAAHHFTITKTVKANDTCVIMEQLKKEDVSIELQRMVGGDLVASLIK